jgi:hypothetical protein
MNRDDIIRMAREAAEETGTLIPREWNEPLLERFADLVAAHEREAEKQEPVAWMVYTLDGTAAWVTLNPADFTSEHRALPLYTTPPQRQPLTEEEMQAAVAAERKACAKVADLVAREIDDTNGTATYIATAIRARGNA